MWIWMKARCLSGDAVLSSDFTKIAPDTPPRLVTPVILEWRNEKSLHDPAKPLELWVIVHGHLELGHGKNY